MLLAADQPAKAVPRAQVKIMVVDGYRASPNSWNPPANPRQRETTIVDKDGGRVKVRLTEFE
jgi:hypothetical protein